MSILYKQARVGKNGKLFTLYKLRTLKPTDRKFAQPEEYTRFGHTLRKYKIDELPQLWNVLKGDMCIIGPRPDVQAAYDIMPEHARNTILSVKPGLTSLASIHFHDEEKLLQEAGEDKYKTYYTRIKPAKVLLDTFYIQNKCLLLNIAILYMTAKLIVKKLFA